MLVALHSAHQTKASFICIDLQGRRYVRLPAAVGARCAAHEGGAAQKVPGLDGAGTKCAIQSEMIPLIPLSALLSYSAPSPPLWEIGAF